MTGKTDQSSTRVSTLNDELRPFARGGRIMITPDIQALGDGAVARVLTAVAAFDAFTDRDDPYGEHDCAVMAVNGIEVLFKIDYYAVTSSITRRIRAILPSRSGSCS